MAHGSTEAPMATPTLWLALLIRSIPALLFGLLTVFWPDVPPPTRNIVTGIYFLLAALGVLMMVRPLAATPINRNWVCLQGVLWLIGGLLVLAAPRGPGIYILIAGISTLLAGAAEFAFTLRCRHTLETGRDLLIAGGLTIVTGVSVLAIGPVASRAPAGVMGAGALATGVALAITAAANRYETRSCHLQDEVE